MSVELALGKAQQPIRYTKPCGLLETSLRPASSAPSLTWLLSYMTPGSVQQRFTQEQCDASPIIFYDNDYVQMLTKRFTPYAMKCTEKNVVLEKNYEVFKALFNDEPSPVSEPRSTKTIVQQKQLPVFSGEQAQKSINEKRKKTHDSLVSKKTSPNTLYNLSQTFSNLSKNLLVTLIKMLLKKKVIRQTD